MPGGNRTVIRSVIPGDWKANGVFTGGGAAANCTKTTGAVQGGIASVNYNAATGKYRITFVDVGQQIIRFLGTVGRADAAVPLFVIPIHSSFSRANKTLDINVRTEAALTDLATTDQLQLEVVFTDIGPNT